MNPVLSFPSHFLKIHFNIILPSTLRLPSEFFPSKLCMHLLSPIRATFPLHLILLDLITRIIFGEEYGSLSSSFCCLLHFPITSSPLGPNIFLGTLFSNNLSLCSSPGVRYDSWHPYKKRLNLVLYIFVFIFLDSKMGGKKILHRMIAHIPRLQYVLNFFMNGILICSSCPKYPNCSTISTDLLPVFMLGVYRACWRPDMSIYLIFSAFASRQIFLLATTKTLCVFLIYHR